jgi:hypothetical protein
MHERDSQSPAPASPIENTTISVLSTETGRFVLPIVAAGPARLTVSLVGYAFV